MTVDRATFTAILKHFYGPKNTVIPDDVLREAERTGDVPTPPHGGGWICRNIMAADGTVYTVGHRGTQEEWDAFHGRSLRRKLATLRARLVAKYRRHE